MMGRAWVSVLLIATLTGPRVSGVGGCGSLPRNRVSEVAVIRSSLAGLQHRFQNLKTAGGADKRTVKKT